MPEITWPDITSTNPGISFKPTRTTYNVCQFQNRLNFANEGLSAAYRDFWKPVPRIENVFQQTLPDKQPNWFDELIPYDADTNTYKISSRFQTNAENIQTGYFPNRQYALHPALNPYWDSVGGFRQGRTPVFEIDPTLPPFMNNYLVYKKWSNILKGTFIVSEEIPDTVKNEYKEQTAPVSVSSAKTINITIKG